MERNEDKELEAERKKAEMQTALKEQIELKRMMKEEEKRRQREEERREEQKMIMQRQELLIDQSIDMDRPVRVKPQGKKDTSPFDDAPPVVSSRVAELSYGVKNIQEIDEPIKNLQGTHAPYRESTPTFNQANLPALNLNVPSFGMGGDGNLRRIDSVQTFYRKDDVYPIQNNHDSLYDRYRRAFQYSAEYDTELLKENLKSQVQGFTLQTDLINVSRGIFFFVQ
eukprot:TRINITY_DN8038_c0_g1_i4.p2 TRINITY_DN8038_c0_g1~~TRINITY_DN8038_c0_g1_i4.p2  ORF type:complete len:225 (+),score=37.47 TRINITY_DN8038_c0_g1_i4:643-1317(+)